MSIRVYIYASQKEESQSIKAKLLKRLAKANIAVVDEEQAFDYIITIGGDGTLLSAFQRLQNRVDSIQFIGIHTGHLGFYADWQSYEIEALVEGLLDCVDKPPVTYPLLEITMEDTIGNNSKFLALNECSIRSNFGTMVSDIYVKEEFFETLRGDGLCIATPTGSTGLNKSLGGAVIHPRLDALQLTEIASLNNRVYRSLGSPMIIAKDEWLKIYPTIHGKGTTFMLMFDNKYISDIEIQSLVLKISDSRIRFANIRHTHFWNRVEASFIGLKQQQNNINQINNLLK